MDMIDLLSALFLVAIVVVAFRLGRQSNTLARMEITAATQVAKQEVGWEYQRYRIEALRMDWVALSPQARKEYCHTWSRPKWATTPKAVEAELGNVKMVTTIGGRS